MRRLRYAAAAVGGLIGLIVIAALVVEFLIVPRQAVAEVGSTTITLREWQEMVKYQRAQLIYAIERQFEDFVGEEPENREQAEGDALRLIQQFSGQQIGLLANGAEQLGEFVLDQMVDDALIRLGATERGITVSEADVERIIGERYNYYDGGLPTPVPSATPSPQPTPSLTPVGFEAAAAVEGVEPTATVVPGPTNTPFPTATPVSRESFESDLNTDLEGIRAAGGNADLFRQIAANAVYRERLAEALFVEQERPTRVPHTSAFILTYDSQEAADRALADVEGLSYLEVWNRVRSLPAPTPAPEGDEAAEPEPLVEAVERLWLTAEQYNNFLPADVVTALFELPVGAHSQVLRGTDLQTGEERFYILQVSGREDRDLDEFTIRNRQQELLNTWLGEQRVTRVTLYENWRTRVPRTPVLDAFFRNPAPTITPQPTVILATPSPAAGDGETDE